MDTEQQAYKQKLNAKLKEFDAEIDKMAAQAESANADAKASFQNQLKTLRDQRDALNEKLADIGEANASAFQEMQKGVEKAWDDLASAVKTARDKFK